MAWNIVTTMRLTQTWRSAYHPQMSGDFPTERAMKGRNDAANFRTSGGRFCRRFTVALEFSFQCGYPRPYPVIVTD